MYNACTPTHPLYYSACLPNPPPHRPLPSLPCHRIARHTPRSLARPTLTITPASCARRTLLARNGLYTHILSFLICSRLGLSFSFYLCLLPLPHPLTLPYARACHTCSLSPGAVPRQPTSSRLLAPPIGYLLCYPAPSARPPYSLYVPPYLGPPNYLHTPSPPRLPRGRTCIRRTRTRIRPLY